ncbi:MAG TPA: hypothetical protein VNM87_12590, partial [Candidatus Udaeobacter sp.]|nr:hypothetical protein [Candidatus Udaeobacter sp.]
MAAELILLPEPRRRLMTGEQLVLAPADEPHAQTVIERGAIGHAEGYRLTIGARGAEIVAEDDAG